MDVLLVRDFEVLILEAKDSAIALMGHNTRGT